ncbi:hypothetical protein [Herbaspirillum rubrisubalbicans]|uniref:hypothetical protein n=1 Tax=Herbaspirillum rubrisubalbicans TaxID=80842 RepID=UPI000AAE43F5|nr:hypothetical protein [Herbaspirillum rubrisubalbicans]
MRRWKAKRFVSSGIEFVPSEDAKAYYDKYWSEAQTRLRSSSDNFDKSILTYSSSGLAVSLAFLKDFVSVSTAIFPALLYFSWLLFVLATSLTISSFLISYREQEICVEFAEQYFLLGREECRNRATWRSTFIKYSNIISGVSFVLALVATAGFVTLNLHQGKDMATKGRFTQDGMPSASMQKVPSTGGNDRGMPPASMPSVPSSTPALPSSGNGGASKAPA